MTTSQNTCPALAGIAKAILPTLSAEDLADVLKSVEPAVMQEALVRSQIVGMNPSHLQLAIDHQLITKEQILETIGHTEPSLSQVLSERTVHEVMDVMDGLYVQEEILQAMGLDGSLIGPHDEIDTDLVVSRVSERTDGLETLIGSIYGVHHEEQILDALVANSTTRDILDYFDSSDLGEAAGDEWHHEDDLTDSWLCDRLDSSIVIRYLRENLS